MQTSPVLYNNDSMRPTHFARFQYVYIAVNWDETILIHRLGSSFWLDSNVVFAVSSSSETKGILSYLVKQNDKKIKGLDFCIRNVEENGIRSKWAALAFVRMPVRPRDSGNRTDIWWCSVYTRNSSNRTSNVNIASWLVLILWSSCQKQKRRIKRTI
jgi:hypothetical protein